MVRSAQVSSPWYRPGRAVRAIATSKYARSLVAIGVPRRAPANRIRVRAWPPAGPVHARRWFLDVDEADGKSAHFSRLGRQPETNLAHSTV